MKNIMISIQPEYCELIASGKKTIEVRKTAPKAPFREFIYCTKDKRGRIGKPYKNYEHIGIWEKTFCPPSFVGFGGKVIGEFICDKVENIPIDSEAFAAISKPACITIDELIEYCSGKDMYGMHISDIKVYDKPRDLSEYFVYNKELEKRFIDGEYYCCYDATNEYGEAMTECDGENIHNCYRCWE